MNMLATQDQQDSQSVPGPIGIHTRSSVTVHFLATILTHKKIICDRS